MKNGSFHYTLRLLVDEKNASVTGHMWNLDWCCFLFCFSAQRAKQHLPFLQRAGKMQGLVEAVISGHRYKVYIPREGVTILFSPSGIKTPARPQAATAGRPAVKVVQ